MLADVDGIDLAASSASNLTANAGGDVTNPGTLVIVAQPRLAIVATLAPTMQVMILGHSVLMQQPLPPLM